MATPIIAFSKDWHEDPTSNHHVLRELAKTRRVLWLNSIATRRPSVGSARDLGKIKRKLREFTRGAVNVENDLWVATPLVFPLPHSPSARALNRQIMRAHDPRACARSSASTRSSCGRSCRTRRTTSARSARSACPSTTASTSGRRSRGSTAIETRRAERRLLAARRCARSPPARRSPTRSERYCAATYLAPHGVDHAKFAAALDPATPVPADLAALPGPRIGFFGTLRELPRLRADRRDRAGAPTWSIALIGQQLARSVRAARPAERPPARPEAARTSCRPTARASTSA